ncbi:sigma-54-dependent Fis family transcriptional regulator [Candidatus Enterococcus murrayae]|uniref:PrpR N-terminal domain-containing protein n=1 Tax=Candidatus Enterococcus murrayae TaxID=2815321 RepID=A0ABS3HHT3_9ENTE|nr:sigma-54-dependent Fis family transcriptional regulator [Enterococcus sp. MJM16]MBO0453009.1 PrpR N-terminal domain-containing protein [Enterococcus sp. MJM16]
MSIKIKILGIAPYDELNNSMNIVSKQFSEVESDIYTADLQEGQKVAAELFHDGYDAIISRGGTADLIRQVVSIPVIDVSISIYDILGTIRLAKNYTENFAIVGYASITETAHLLCDILGYNIKIITLDETTDASTTLDVLVEENYEMILCDAITNRLALTKAINTILITSGFESVKHAYQEALTIAKQLKRVIHEKSVLEESIKQQKQDFVVLDDRFHVYFSNVAPNLSSSLARSLSTKKDMTDENQYYHTFENKVYMLSVKKISIDDSIYYSCNLNVSTPPIINNRFGIFYQKRAEIEEIFTTKLLFTQFIQEETKRKLRQVNNFYNSIIIVGETGTAKSSIAYQAFLNQKIHNNQLISIDAKLMNEKMWKFLVNPTNGPLVDENNTLLFQNIEQLTVHDAEQLITIVKNTKLLQRNNLLFTYNTNNVSEEKIYHRLLFELNCASIYAPPIKERKHELNVITTLLLNKLNIECNKDVIGFDPNALNEFLAFDWPGNFNQLQSGIKELVINASTHYISEHQVVQLLKKERLLQNFSDSHLGSFSLQTKVENPTLFDYSKEIILSVLEQNNGNQTKTAEQLGISRTTLWRYLKEG